MPHLLDHPLISQRYFFPRRDAVEPATLITTDVELRCHHHAPHPGAPTVLHFHGNGEVVADWVPELPQALAARGLNTFLAEYRGYGGSGGEPQLAAMLDDALAAFDQLSGPVIVYGRSVGSLYALHVAAHRKAAALVVESGIADVRERLLLRVTPDELGVTAAQLDVAMKATVDHEAKMRAVEGPVLILHADADHLVDVRHARQLAAWAGERSGGAETTLRVYDRGDHNSIHVFNGAAILDEVAALAERLT
jgi:alpha-beta hydrolase superfamily lysophospholipase